MIRSLTAYLCSSLPGIRAGRAAGCPNGSLTISGVFAPETAAGVCLVSLRRIFALPGRHLLPALIIAATMLFTPKAHAAPAQGDLVTNTAALLSEGTILRSSTVSATYVKRTPAVIELFQFAPGATGSVPTIVPATAFQNGSSSADFTTLGLPAPVGGQPIDISSPVPLLPTVILHAGDPLFIRVIDPDPNLDRIRPDTILITLTDSKTGDTEVLRLTETGPDTGIFIGYIQTKTTTASSYDGTISVIEDSSIIASYTDPGDGTDTVAAATLVDPFGRVFDSISGNPVNGATVSIVNAATGLPANVFGDNGVSAFPATVTSGGTATDAGGRVYTFPAGGFRFPFMAPGSYRITVTPPASYSAPSTANDTSILALPGGPFVILTPGSRGETFILNAGPALRIDIPLDPLQTSIWVQKTAGKELVSIGDFIPYDIRLTNNSATLTITGAKIVDTLPKGFRYRSGSTRLNGSSTTEPAVSPDGRTLTFLVGDIPVKGDATVRYVVEVGAGAATGSAVNSATASASTSATSNTATARVRVQQPFLTSKSIIMGRVVVGPCSDNIEEITRGMEGIGIFLEDGTFVLSDKRGMFHFEGVQPGTHVLQLDLDSIPEGYRIQQCEENSRFAGRAYSQFVDLQGGAIWSADFYLARNDHDPPPVESKTEKKATIGMSAEEVKTEPTLPQTRNPVKGEISLLMNSIQSGDVVDYSIPMQSATVPLKNLRLVVSLPAGAVYKPGSSTINGALISDPEVSAAGLLYNLGDAPLSWRRELQLRAVVGANAKAGELVTKAFLTFDTETANNIRTPEVTNILVLERNERTTTLPPFIVRPQFPTFGAELNEADRKQLDELAQILSRFKISKIDVDGHTDIVRIAPRSRHIYADNTALSFARARSVGRYLASALHLPPEMLQLSGSGESSPIASNFTPEGRALNRRVEVRIVTENRLVSTNLKMIKDRSNLERVETIGAPIGASEPKTLQLQPAATTADMVIPSADNPSAATVVDKQQPAAAAVTPQAAPLPDDGKHKGSAIRLDKDEEHVVLLAAYSDGLIQYRIRYKAANDPAKGLKATVSSPQGAMFISGSATINGSPVADPESTETALVFTLPNKSEEMVLDFRFQTLLEGDPPPAGTRISALVAVTNTAGEALRALPVESGLSESVDTIFTTMSDSQSSAAAASRPPAKDEFEPFEERLPARSAQPQQVQKKNDQLRVTDEQGILSYTDGQMLATRINSVRVVLNSSLTPVLSLDGVEIASDRIGFSLKDRESEKTLYTFIGVDFGDEGEHRLQLKGIDPFGQVRFDKNVKLFRAGEITSIRLVSADGNIADGRTPVRIRVQMHDNHGRAVHANAELTVKESDLKPLKAPGVLAKEGNSSSASVTPDGWVQFQPVTASGLYRVQLSYNKAAIEIETYVKPKFRDWILVGLAEGTVGYSTVSGHMESLKSSGEEENFYDRERLAFYAKGTIKGEWLLTMAFDSKNQKNGTSGNSALFQTVDPNAYYTLYGDATSQGYDASSARGLYLKLERDQFYAMFGDFDTGMSVTELSRYSRRMNGIKSELRTKNLDITVFGSETGQTFVKDELRGDGTSGTYRLSRKNLVINSEKIMIESRDRFKSEVIVSTRQMARFIDYNIDYDSGTFFFKEPVASKDDQLNPVYIVADYEIASSGADAMTYGGRGGVKLLDNNLKLGGTYVHEGHISGSSNLYGVDGTLTLGEGTKLKVEAATTGNDLTAFKGSGSAYLAELTHTGNDLNSKLYFREQDEGFGMGQQKGSETGTRKFGGEGTYRLNKLFSTNGQAYRQYNLATGAVRDLVDGTAVYSENDFSTRTGLRYAGDSLGDGSRMSSVQATVGGSWKTLNKKLTLRADHEQSLFNKNNNADFPTRTIIGADYQAGKKVTLFAQEELTYGAASDTNMTRIGVKATPWNGGTFTSSVSQTMKENSERTFANAGLTQKWQVSPSWTVDGSLDRNQTIRNRDGYQFNTNVPAASGGEDFTAVSLGTNYIERKLIWSNRIEFRTSELEDKWGLLTGVVNEQGVNWGWTSRLQATHSNTVGGSKASIADLRLGLAYRPPVTRWIVLDRLDLVASDESSSISSSRAKKIVNNLNANYRPNKETQLSMQYGAKYLFETIDNSHYSGFTDLIGLEGRYDITRKWDLGLRGSLLHSWALGQFSYSLGPSIGYNMVKNAWVSLGYNLIGFNDKDFSVANFTSQGPFVQFRFKFDQNTVKEGLEIINH